METRVFTKATLLSFIDSDYFYQLENLPINRQRAISHVNNPRAEEDDVLLVAQFDELKTVGYLGVLPDFMFHNDSKVKVGWLTCFWVDDAYKSKGVAANLFRRVIKAWDKKILITNLVPSQGPMYQKTKIFRPTQHKTGFRGYLRLNLAEILPPKRNIFNKTKGLLRFIDSSLNFFFNKRFLFYNWKDIQDIKYEYHLDVDSIPDEIIENSFINNYPRRGKAELNWIVKYPWIIEGGKKDLNSERYYFSSLNNRFFYQIVSFKDHKNNITALLLMIVRENNLTIPYVYFNNDSKPEAIAKFLIKRMIELKLNMVTTFNKTLEKALRKQRSHFIYSKQINKPYLISKNIEIPEELNFQDGDGDCTFY